MFFAANSSAALGFGFIDRGLGLNQADGSQVDGRFSGQGLDIGCESLEALIDRLVLL